MLQLCRAEDGAVQGHTREREQGGDPAAYCEHDLLERTPRLRWITTLLPAFVRMLQIASAGPVYNTVWCCQFRESSPNVTTPTIEVHEIDQLFTVLYRISFDQQLRFISLVDILDFLPLKELRQRRLQPPQEFSAVTSRVAAGHKPIVLDPPQNMVHLPRI
ncbi:hypothetical protein B0H17DRAFT_1132732 [Mycena rosella]|uniref:Uncharacterized protein n=1 Tax=Mycena rosella TaxID=1033263 RepID=A0AAD7DJC4_MYCRO|nr:hypothetical protein B0H17DRAFT_1132732 [Mycena rosella]